MDTRRLSTLTLMLLVAVSVSCSSSCSRTHRTQASKYRVIHIADGDTITVLDAETKEIRVRLQGTDAPEKGQAFGMESRRHLSELLLGKEVTLQGDKTDKYGRVLCKVIIDDRDANLEQINAGFAWLYRQYERDLSSEDRDSYANAEIEAHDAKRGLWSEPAPAPPWEYRHPGDRPPSSVQ